MGEASALGAAALWAFSSILLTSQARLTHPVPLSALRGAFASVFLVLVALSSGAIDELREMSANTALSMVGSGVVGMAFVPFLVASAVGRAARFYLVAGLMRWGGERMEKTLRLYIDRIGWVLILAVVIAYFTFNSVNNG